MLCITVLYKYIHYCVNVSDAWGTVCQNFKIAFNVLTPGVSRQFHNIRVLAARFNREKLLPPKIFINNWIVMPSITSYLPLYFDTSSFTTYVLYSSYLIRKLCVRKSRHCSRNTIIKLWILCCTQFSDNGSCNEGDG